MENNTISNKIIYFYSDDDPYYELSNFYQYPFKTRINKYPKLNIFFDGVIWKTSEHIYQALKFHCETDMEKEWREIIRNTPTIAKYLGHCFTYVKYQWHKKYRDLVLKYKPHVRLAGNIDDIQLRTEIMLKALRAKFSDDRMQNILISTENCILKEASNDIWSEVLGELLMQIRNEIKK